MRVPFERLVEMVDALDRDDTTLTLGELSKRWGESTERIMDAIDASKMLRGQRTYIRLPSEEDR